MAYGGSSGSSTWQRCGTTDARTPWAMQRSLAPVAAMLGNGGRSISSLWELKSRKESIYGNLWQFILIHTNL